MLLHVIKLVVVVLAGLWGPVSAQQSLPNIIIMYMDDMGWGDLGVHGSWVKETPQIDKMAAEGMLFTNFYTAAAICSPSRASLMTGRLPIRNGFYSDNRHGVNAYATGSVLGGINASEILISEFLRDAGYKSKVIGKWHLGHQEQYLPLSRGFDEFYGSPGCHACSNPKNPVYRDDRMIGRYCEDNFPIEHGLANLTLNFIDEAEDFIEKYAGSETPFLLYWTPDANHVPCYASEMFKGKSRRGNAYGDSVMEVDYGVGRILDKLREHGIDQETLVVFSSDNGAETLHGQSTGSNGPLLCGKQTTFEGGFRVPGIFWWPGVIAPGTVSHQLGTTMDLFVTAAEMAGLPLPSDRIYDGINLLPILKGEVEEIERPIWYYRGNEMFAVRVGKYKAHYWTWSHKHYEFCPGQRVEGLTTPEQVNRTESPLVVDLEKCAGEKFVMGSFYAKQVLKNIRPYVEEHRANLKPGYPSLNYCGHQGKSWAPKGCEEINSCLPHPEETKVHLCGWDH